MNTRKKKPTPKKSVRRTKVQKRAKLLGPGIYPAEMFDVTIVGDTISVSGQLHLPYRRPSNPTAYWKVGV